METSIYRLRPINKNTIDELKNQYLWFSKPHGFKDVEDANIGLFIEQNTIVRDALLQVFSPQGIEELADKMRHIGICCFTKVIPSCKDKLKFPNGHNSIVIEYDKTAIKEFFYNSKYANANCFKSVIYTNEPIRIIKDDEYHYLYSEDEKGCFYKSIKELKLHPRYIDDFLFFLLTRLNTKFKIQKEERIIFSGHNIKEFNEDINGYSITIPPECIKHIHYYSKCDSNFLDSISELGYDINTINN